MTPQADRERENTCKISIEQRLSASAFQQLQNKSSARGVFWQRQGICLEKRRDQKLQRNHFSEVSEEHVEPLKLRVWMDNLSQRNQ